jgi:hypothetical protein
MQTYEYINDFLFFVIRPDEGRGKGTFIYCSGVNISRFLPVTKGRHGRGSNPAMRGLQEINHGIRSLALSKGAVPKSMRGNDCAGIAPTKDTWTTELLLIENADDSLPQEIIDYAVVNLIRKIVNACMLYDANPPDRLIEPKDLQEFIESMCARYGSKTV